MLNNSDDGTSWQLINNFILSVNICSSGECTLTDELRILGLSKGNGILNSFRKTFHVMKVWQYVFFFTNLQIYLGFFSIDSSVEVRYLESASSFFTLSCMNLNVVQSERRPLILNLLSYLDLYFIFILQRSYKRSRLVRINYKCQV